jgi:hypothetical protein
MAVIQISEADAGPEVKVLIDHVRHGDTVRISGGPEEFEVVRLSNNAKPRMISDVIKTLEMSGSNCTSDSGFADDIEDGIRAHQQEPRFDPWA